VILLNRQAHYLTEMSPDHTVCNFIEIIIQKTPMIPVQMSSVRDGWTE